MTNCPQEWEKIRLGHVIKRINDIWPDRDKWYFEKFIAGAHFDPGEIRIKKSEYIKGNEKTIGYQFQWRFKPGDVLYVVKNPRLRKAGIVNFEGICSISTFVIRSDESKLIQSLLPFILQTEDFVFFACNNAHGSTNPFLNWKDIVKYDLALPTIPEQKKISEILWAIEENIEKTEKLLEITKKLKKGLLDQLLTKGIGHSKFKETGIGEIPKEWEVVKFGEIVDFEMGKTPSRENNLYWNGGKYYWVTISDMKDSNYIYETKEKISEKAFEEIYNKKLVPKDTLLMSFKLTIGRVSLLGIDALHNEAIISIYPKERVLKEYLYYYLPSIDFSNFTGEAVKGKTLNKSKLKSLPILLPSLTDQLKIIDYMQTIDNTAETYKSHITHLSNLKKKLTNEFLSGNIRIPPGVLKNVQ